MPTEANFTRGEGSSSAVNDTVQNINFLDQVITALRGAGLGSCKLIFGIDFTESNKWTGKKSFNNRCLHAFGDTPNPYQIAISIIGRILASFNEDNLIPCFGFGDATTNDQGVFSFCNDHSACHGVEDVLARYRNIVPYLRLAGPTSYAPVVEAAIDIVEKSGDQYHVLFIIADGEVTRSVDTGPGELSPEEEKTVKSLVDASSYPLSIVLVGVGDGPMEHMEKLTDKIPAREFDNFHFVDFTAIMSKDTTLAKKETTFAVAALMEIPNQYKAAVELGIMGRATGRERKIVPQPPPVSYAHHARPQHRPSHVPSSDLEILACPICLMKKKNMAFDCGHMTCEECGQKISNCPICRQSITSRLKVFI